MPSGQPGGTQILLSHAGGEGTEGKRKIGKDSGMEVREIEEKPGNCIQRDCSFPDSAQKFYNISIRPAISSFFVAQLVAKRTTVWLSSGFSQKLNATCFFSLSISVSSIRMNCWLVGDSR